MPAAKVPSSSLDKITAEFLEENWQGVYPQNPHPRRLKLFRLPLPSPPGADHYYIRACPGTRQFPPRPRKHCQEPSKPRPRRRRSCRGRRDLRARGPSRSRRQRRITNRRLCRRKFRPRAAAPRLRCRPICLKLVKRWVLLCCRQSQRPARRPRNRPPVVPPAAKLILRGAAIFALFEAEPRLRPPSLSPAKDWGRSQRKNRRPPRRRPSRTNLFRPLPAK